MKCPVCGTEAILQGGNYWCPNDRILLGKNLDIKPKDETDYGKIYRKRSRRSFLLGVFMILILFVLVAAGTSYVVWNYTAFGFREQIMRDYGFTEEAKWYLRRNTSIQVLDLTNKGLGPNIGIHPNRFEPGATKQVKLVSANEEIAMHELAHAWWDHVRTDENLKKGLVEDMIKLSQIEDQEYFEAIILATNVIRQFCKCPDTNNIDFDKVDDPHFYALPVHFMLGKFKDGPRKLPPFMWKYFDGQFTSNLRVTPCYETDSCVSLEVNKDKFCEAFPERKICKQSSDKI